MPSEIDKTNIAQVAESIRQNLGLLHRALHHLQQDLSESIANVAPYRGYKREQTSNFQTRLGEICDNISGRAADAKTADDEKISKRYLEKTEPRRQVAAALWLAESIILNSSSVQTIEIAKHIRTAAENLTSKLGFISHSRFSDNGFSLAEVQKILRHRETLRTIPELSEPLTSQQIKDKFYSLRRQLESSSRDKKGR